MKLIKADQAKLNDAEYYRKSEGLNCGGVLFEGGGDEFK